MILFLALIAITAVGGVVLVGSRTHALSKVRERIRTPRSMTPVPPVTYFERYMPKRTSGQGDAL